MRVRKFLVRDLQVTYRRYSETAKLFQEERQEHPVYVKIMMWLAGTVEK